MTLRSKIDKLLEVGLSILLGVMVVNVLWQVASRYLLSNPSTFTDELSRYLLIWLGLLGAAYASGKRMHVAIELLSRKLNDQQKETHHKLVSILIFLFSLVVLIIGGIRLAIISFNLGQTSSAMQLSLGYVYLAIPISGLIMCYYTLCDIFNID